MFLNDLLLAGSYAHESESVMSYCTHLGYAVPISFWGKWPTLWFHYQISGHTDFNSYPRSVGWQSSQGYGLE